MEHNLFIDGTVKEYTWSIKTGKNIVEQIREHPEPYVSGGKLDVKNKDESKFIAVHVGRNLKINYKLIESNDNLATRLLLLDKDSIGRDSRGYV